MRLRGSVLLFHRLAGESLSVGRIGSIRERLSEMVDLAEETLDPLEAGLGTATAMTATSAVPMEIEATDAC